ncbi:uncharacterized protein ACIB01_004766 [Guaruba guarouba]
MGQLPGKAAPRLHLPSQKCWSGWERLFEPSSAPSLKPVVCCVQVTQLVEFLIYHHEELLGEQTAGLASAGDDETPSPQAELETAEVPPVAPKSEQQRSFSGENRFPGSSHNTRKRRAAWEEVSDGPPCPKKSKTEL